ncbi:hypothetical protein BT63DRAFT_437870 [Microthyrium microscopicum]|uniref:Knr4/Smi1-like domain-containing protein n=1 Tax=Microthyrium microscopicum TaxID=703497 RepID=A0A6A6UI56_9PEZI|nr:hypothetical protein BT63DRAFT_437870 [Microthyrium microscopicum]
MALLLKAERILCDRNFDSLWFDLSQYAVELALLGEIDLSRHLVSLLFTSGAMRPYSRPTFGGLTFAWNQTQDWPQGLLEEASSEAVIEELREQYRTSTLYNLQKLQNPPPSGDDKVLEMCVAHFQGRWKKHYQVGTWRNEEDVKQLLVRALELSLQISEGIPPSSADIQDKQGTENKDGMDQDRSRIKVADLDDISSDILRRLAAGWNYHGQQIYLSEAEHLWPYYMKGLLADAMQISQETVRTRGKAVINAFSKRLREGRKAILDGKSIKELLEIGSHNTISGPGLATWAENAVEPPETLFREPATIDEIAKLEERLNIQLPEEYKEFLLISNGFGGIFNGFFNSAALFSVDEVKWNYEKYFRLPVEVLNLPYEIQDLADKIYVREETFPERKQALPLFDRVLEIGHEGRDNVWLVQPYLFEQAKAAYQQMYDRADAGQKYIIERAMEGVAGSKEDFEKMEWAVITWASGSSANMVGYGGFRRYLQDSIEDSSEVNKKTYFMEEGVISSCEINLYLGRIAFTDVTTRAMKRYKKLKTPLDELCAYCAMDTVPFRYYNHLRLSDI